MQQDYNQLFLDTVAKTLSPLDLKREADLSLFCDLSGLQDSFRFRIQRRSQEMAALLIDDQGELDQAALTTLLHFFEKTPFIYVPGGSSDLFLSKHQVNVLKKLRDDPGFYRGIKRIRLPLCHRGAELLVCETLSLFGGKRKLTDRDVRQAVLSACLSLVRQNVGSCFATAPAIVIHEEQLDGFLADMDELLSTGKLKRTFGGVEHTVPLSPSSGIGDLRKPLTAKYFLSPGLLAAFEVAGLIDPSASLQQRVAALERIASPHLARAKTVEELISSVLLEANGSASEKEVKAAFKATADNALVKSWEFTLASFSEIKMEFSKWNLYSSLGLNPDEKGGLGAVIYQIIDRKLQETNEKVERFQEEYQIAFSQVKGTESLLKQAGTEAEIRRLQAEYQARVYHMHACLDTRDRAHELAARYASLFSFLIEQYHLKFEEYFQEIYDAEMQEATAHLYEDAPAGFRLVYKHGRREATLWSFIYNEQEWIQALIQFFIAVEAPLVALFDFDQDFAEITAAIVRQLRSEEFAQTAYVRTKKRHGSWARPWAYVSGGSMDVLLKTYFKREAPVSEEVRQVEGSLDLLLFLLDTLKHLPSVATTPFLDRPDQGMLITSPTHAFVLHPGWPLMKRGWMDPGFTYTWVRDQVVLPMQKFYEEIRLSIDEQEFLIQELAAVLPGISAPLLPRASLIEFRKGLTSSIKKQETLDQIDGFLFEMIPLTPKEECQTAIEKIIDAPIQERIMGKRWMGSKALQEMCKTAIIQLQGSTASEVDLHQHVAQRARALGYASPAPLLFADTNWANAYFSFAVNPGTGQFGLWRMDAAGIEGVPMSSWNQWMDGTQRSSWNLFTHTYQYLR
jgi:hypothetical protein